MKYDLGLVIGRFQMFHNGHKYIIDRALDECKKVVIFVGSSQESGNSRNPFSFQARRNMIEKCFDVDYKIGRLVVLPLPDQNLGNNTSWGKYVLDTFVSTFNKQPDLYITGVEKERPSWFDDNIAPEMCELRIPRARIKVSATECRNALLTGDYDTWRKNVPYQLYDDLKYCESVLKDIQSKEEGKK